MNLYLVHCGFYDPAICDGLYESHVNFFVVARTFEEARQNAKSIPEFQNKKMHIDSLQEVRAVGGHRLSLVEDLSLGGQTIAINYKHRELAPKTDSEKLLESAIELHLKLTHEQRISAHENARELANDLREAGKELHAGPKGSS